MKNKNIILIGYMACGKSSIGQMLSKQLNCSMIDTDKYIEKKSGKRIKEIFADEGESYFRQLETQSINDLIESYAHSDERIVIATGGGLPMKEENRKLLKQLGHVFLLEASKETIFERIKGDTTRPLLQCENPMERIGNMLKERKTAYEETADVKISVDHKKKDQIVEEILKIQF